jgi:hypothetical protein
MSFSMDMAELVANQLSRFVTLNRHQLAGQVANLDFWLAQVRHALRVIDGYGVRFIQMKAAQERYVAANGTIEFALNDEEGRGAKASPPHRIPDRELQKAHRALTKAAFHFLDRCRRDGLISELRLTEALKLPGIEQEPV